MLPCAAEMTKSNTMHQIKTQLAEFSAAHRLIKDYQGKCRTLHGHNYRVFLTFSAQQLDHNDFVTDFSVIKRTCNQWIKDHWDHAVLISSDDLPLLEFAQDNQQKHYVFADGANTTVEVLCQHFYDQINPLVVQDIQAINPSIVLNEVEIWETHSACARYTAT